MFDSPIEIIEKSADLFHPPALRITGIGQNWQKNMWHIERFQNNGNSPFFSIDMIHNFGVFLTALTFFIYAEVRCKNFLNTGDNLNFVFNCIKFKSVDNCTYASKGIQKLNFKTFTNIPYNGKEL